MKRDLSYSSGLRFPEDGTAGVRVALSAELPRARSFVTKKVDGQGVLLTRDRNGVVHAFRNECLHRSAALTKGCGRVRKLTCRKHGWKYDLEGNLLDKVGTAGARRLPRLTVVERDGQIWVRFLST